ncbi:hypothetical protein [Acinetobacter sp. ANC 3832]|uniref:hypothetical protein n=1 Tax=Acinetobacter sp. ANC 3832 TaxID=1977874 RepID=UPI001D17BEDD|nr:hypothetical protein [Acinetobacter sp. ANC 3832]
MGAFSATETNSIRTSTDFIEVGSSQRDIVQKLGRPESTYEYKIRDRNGRLVFATDFYYSIDGLKYTITVVGSHVTKIVWER